jgi:hypothetical protein
MNSKNTLPSIALISGIIISLIGAVLIIGYIMEAYVARRGDPDQSLLFWYLPLLFVGFISFVTGLSASVWGFNRLRKVEMKRPFSIVILLLLIIIISVPLSIVVTIVLSPFWSWLETSTGIESLGHSGPAEWCYLVIFLILVATITGVYLIYQRSKKKNEV